VRVKAKAKAKTSSIGKTEMIQTWKEAGLDEKQANIAYEAQINLIESGLRVGRGLYYEGVLKVWPVRRPPKKHWDNIKKKDIYFGERWVLKAKLLPSVPKERPGMLEMEAETESGTVRVKTRPKP
jgi:hypothetical protein